MEHCDLCGGAQYEVVWDKTEREKHGKLKSVVIRKDGEIVQGRNVICKRCGLVFVSPKMSREELAEFYERDYRKIYGGSHSLEAETRHAHTAAKILEDCLGDIVGKTLLDIGCSTGKLIEAVGGAGIEPNRKHYLIATDKKLNVENVSIENYNPGIKFDIITMLNALEHVYSPTEVLNKINSLLNDNGHVLICVPNIYNRTIHLPVDVFLSNAHLYNFSLDTLAALFAKCGFKTVRAIQVTEEMGDKIYLLGQKTNKKAEYEYKFRSEKIDLTKKHLKVADRVFEMKSLISDAGFR